MRICHEPHAVLGGVDTEMIDSLVLPAGDSSPVNGAEAPERGCAGAGCRRKIALRKWYLTVLWRMTRVQRDFPEKGRSRGKGLELSCGTRVTPTVQPD